MSCKSVEQVTTPAEEVYRVGDHVHLRNVDPEGQPLIGKITGLRQRRLKRETRTVVLTAWYYRQSDIPKNLLSKAPSKPVANEIYATVATMGDKGDENNLVSVIEQVKVHRPKRIPSNYEVRTSLFSPRVSISHRNRSCGQRVGGLAYMVTMCAHKSNLTPKRRFRTLRRSQISMSVASHSIPVQLIRSIRSDQLKVISPGRQSWLAYEQVVEGPAAQQRQPLQRKLHVTNLRPTKRWHHHLLVHSSCWPTPDSRST
jgi:hypothetical protein